MCGTIWQHLPPCQNIINKIPYGEQCGGSYKLMFLVVAWILAYNFFMAIYWPNINRVNVDIFNRKIIDFDYFMSNCCSMWPISHFIFFFILGLLFPHCDVPIISAGIIWEILEESIAIIRSDQQTKHVVVSDSKIQYRDSWWAGNMQDILFNIMGFYLAKIFVVKILKIRICIKGLNC